MPTMTYDKDNEDFRLPPCDECRGVEDEPMVYTSLPAPDAFHFGHCHSCGRSWVIPFEKAVQDATAASNPKPL